MGYDEERRDLLDDASEAAQFAVDTTRSIYDTANYLHEHFEGHSDIENASSPEATSNNAKSGSDAQDFSTTPSSSDTSPTSFSSEATQNEINQRLQQELTSSAAQNASTSAVVNTATGEAVATGTAEATAGAVATSGTAATAEAGGAAAGSAAASGAAAGGSSGAAGASAGAGPIGLIVAAVIAVAGAGAKKVGKDYQEITGDSNNGGNLGIALVLLALLIVAILVATIVAPIYLLYSYVTAPVRVLQEGVAIVSHYIEQEQKEAFFEDLLGLSDVTDAISKQQELNEESVEIYKDIIDYAIYKSFKNYCWDLFLDMPTILNLAKEGYSPGVTYAKFCEQPYPYSLRTSSNGEPITVGYYLKHHDTVVNNDLNYAELFAVLSQSNDYTLSSFTYSDFYDLLLSDDTVKHLFEVQIVDTGYSTLESVAALDDITEINDDSLDIINKTVIEEAEEPNWLEATAEAIKEWWQHATWHFDVELYPMGLQEMYQIVNLSPFDHNAKEDTMTNYELLDYTELWLRELVPNVHLGTAYYERRNERSNAYWYLYNAQLKAFGNVTLPTGRSAVSYTDTSFVYSVAEGLSYAQAYCQKRLHVETRVPQGSSVVLDMYGLIDQTAQSGYRGTWNGIGEDPRTTIAHEGCIDCCYIMAYEYFYRERLNVQEICANYVNSNNQFEHGRFRTDYNLPGSRAGKTYNAENMKACLASGSPLVLFINGHWEYGGRVYHRSSQTHYILIVGYDNVGFYVYDPGGKSGQDNTNNGPIPYNAFYDLSVKSYISFDVTQNMPVHYLFNTLIED